MCLAGFTDRKGGSAVHTFVCYSLLLYIHSDIQADIFADTSNVEM